jgi:hypothetical protein
VSSNNARVVFGDNRSDCGRLINRKIELFIGKKGKRIGIMTLKINNCVGKEST